jgi:hypothetical protein
MLNIQGNIQRIALFTMDFGGFVLRDLKPQDPTLIGLSSADLKESLGMGKLG